MDAREVPQPAGDGTAPGDASSSDAATAEALFAQLSGFSGDALKLVDWIQKGGNFASLAGFSDDDLDIFYAAAYQLYEAGRHEEALPVFGFLAGMDSLDTRYHLGVGSCLQCAGRYKEAAGSFVLLKILEPDQPEHLLHLAECLLGTGDADAAAGILDSLLEECKGPEHAELKSRGEAMLKLLREPAPAQTTD